MSQSLHKFKILDAFKARQKMLNARRTHLRTDIAEDQSSFQAEQRRADDPQNQPASASGTGSQEHDAEPQVSF